MTYPGSQASRTQLRLWGFTDVQVQCLWFLSACQCSLPAVCESLIIGRILKDSKEPTTGAGLGLRFKRACMGPRDARHPGKGRHGRLAKQSASSKKTNAPSRTHCPHLCWVPPSPWPLALGTKGNHPSGKQVGSCQLQAKATRPGLTHGSCPSAPTSGFSRDGRASETSIDSYLPHLITTTFSAKPWETLNKILSVSAKDVCGVFNNNKKISLHSLIH